MFPILVFKAVIIILERAHQNNTTCVLIPKQGEGFIGGIFEVTETYNITAILNTVQYAVSTAVGLQQTMHSQILVYPQSVHGFGIEPGEEHTHNYQDVNFLMICY